MSHSHLIVRRSTAGGDQILLAQRNIYLPPTERYEFAAVAHHKAAMTRSRNGRELDTIASH